MREYLSKHRMRALGIGTVVTAVIVALLTLYAVPLSPPLGDCFGGALSDDPVHCYVLEQADGDGVIDIEKVYEGDEVLYFSLKQDAMTLSEWEKLYRGPIDEEEMHALYRFVGSDVKAFFKTKLVEYYDRWPADVPDLDFYDNCMRDRDLTYRECYLNSGLSSFGGLPKPVGYVDIRFHSGGEDTRKKVPGWGSWRQVWPIVPIGPITEGESGDSEPTPAFDVSDVDMTNDLPAHECPETYTHRNWCSRNPELAVRVVATRSDGNRTYLQMKDPPEDEEGIAALRYMLNPCYNVQSGPCIYTGTEAVREVVDGVETIVKRTGEVQSSYVPADPNSIGPVIIPVKYDKGELKRWAEILNRFALSAGNTIGITRAEVGNNGGGHSGQDPVYPLDSLQPAPEDAYGPIKSYLRTTILVRGSTDSQQIADALPTLLPLLGIQVDAVGVVLTEGKGDNLSGGGPEVISPDGETAPSQELFASDFAGRVQLMLVSRNVGAVLIMGAIAMLVMWLRRRASST